MPSRTLVLVRHAQAAAAAPSDAERPLTERGTADAAALGRFLAAGVPAPGAVVVSPALRTRQTWAAAAVALPGAPEPQLDPRLYRDGLDGYLGVVREAEDAVDVLVVVAHNPWVARLVHELADRGQAASVPPPTDVPPGGVTVLELPGSWSGAGPGAGTLVAFAAPPYDARG